jgi:hypothetical protein
MRKLLLTCCLAVQAALLSSTAVSAQTNLVINGDLEGRVQAPQVRDNIAPQPAGFDLLNWYRTTSTGANNPFYIAVDGAPAVNPRRMWDYYLQFGQNFSFIPHSGDGCVMLTQHDGNADHYYDNMITQDLRRPLLPGHTYQAGFWALRSVSGRFRSKLALWVTDADPSHDPTSTRSRISPSYGTKIVESDENIVDLNRWTYVSGTITIPAGETNNTWVTVGYSPEFDQYYDAHVEELGTAPNHVSFMQFAIDDISLVDITCPSPALTPVVSFVGQSNCRRVAEYTITNFDPSFQYVVQLAGSLTTTTPYPTTPTILIYDTPGGQGGQIYVTASQQACRRESTASPIQLIFGTCGGVARTAATTAYPNPASESITVPEGVERATLLNDKGRAVRQLAPGGTLDVQNLPAGLYNLQMQQEGKLVNQRIQVQH